MKIETQVKEGAAVVKPIGRLTSATAEDFEKALADILRDEISALTVDMSETEYISSAGIRVLLAACHKLQGKEFFLQNPNASVTEILHVAGLLKVFTVKKN